MDLSIMPTSRRRSLAQARQPASMRPAILLTPSSADMRGSYRAELSSDQLDEQGRTLEWVIGLAFDRLDARHLDLRVVPSDS